MSYFLYIDAFTAKSYMQIDPFAAKSYGNLCVWSNWIDKFIARVMLRLTRIEHGVAQEFYFVPYFSPEIS